MSKNLLNDFEAPEDATGSGDVVGGGFRPFESNVYNFEIEYAFLDISKSEAKCVKLHCKSDDGRRFRQDIYFTSGKAKGCKSTYVDKHDGTLKLLPGYELVNDLCLLAARKNLVKLAPQIQKKTIQLYDFEAKAEVPTDVQMMMPLVGKKITACIQQQIVDKNVENSSGNYVPSGYTRLQSEIVKFLNFKDGRTVGEIQKKEEGTYLAKWLKLNEEQVSDRSKGKKGLVTENKATPANTASASTSADNTPPVDDGDDLFAD